MRSLMSRTMIHSYCLAFAMVAFAVCSCGNAAGPAASVHQLTLTSSEADAVDPFALFAEEPPLPQGPPGKTFFAVPGIYVEVPQGYATSTTDKGVRFTAADESNWFAFEWDPDPQGTFQQVVEGIAGGGQLIKSNGATEQLNKNRTAFTVVVMGRYTGRFMEGRYIVVESGHEQGGFMCVAAINQENDMLFEQAKVKLMAILSTVEHVPQAEVAAIILRQRQAKERDRAAKLASINGRERTPEENRLRQALTGLALVKLNTTVSNSSFGNSSQTSLERFQLCPSGEGSWTYGADMLIQAERVSNQGDITDVGSMTSTTANRAIGTWDVERYEGRFLLIIHTYDGQEKSWNIAPGEDEWSYIVGGKEFHVSKTGGTYGPECR